MPGPTRKHYALSTTILLPASWIMLRYWCTHHPQKASHAKVLFLPFLRLLLCDTSIPAIQLLSIPVWTKHIARHLGVG